MQSCFMWHISMADRGQGYLGLGTKDCMFAREGFVYKKGRLSDKCTASEVFPNLSTAEGRLQSGKTTSRIGAGDGLWTKCLRIVPDRVLIATLPLLLIIARLEE